MIWKVVGCGALTLFWCGFLSGRFRSCARFALLVRRFVWRGELAHGVLWSSSAVAGRRDGGVGVALLESEMTRKLVGKGLVSLLK